MTFRIERQLHCEPRQHMAISAYVQQLLDASTKESPHLTITLSLSSPEASPATRALLEQGPPTDVPRPKLVEAQTPPASPVMTTSASRWARPSYEAHQPASVKGDDEAQSAHGWSEHGAGWQQPAQERQPSHSYGHAAHYDPHTHPPASEASAARSHRSASIAASNVSVPAADPSELTSTPIDIANADLSRMPSLPRIEAALQASELAPTNHDEARDELSYSSLPELIDSGLDEKDTLVFASAQRLALRAKAHISEPEQFLWLLTREPVLRRLSDHGRAILTQLRQGTWTSASAVD